MKTNSDPASYTEQLTRRFLDDGNTPSYQNLDWEERAGVLAELIHSDLAFGWEIIQQMAPMTKDDTDLPEMLAGILQARSEGKYAEIADLSTSLVSYLVIHATDYGEKAINAALEKTESRLRQDKASRKLRPN